MHFNSSKACFMLLRLCKYLCKTFSIIQWSYFKTKLSMHLLICHVEYGVYASTFKQVFDGICSKNDQNQRYDRYINLDYLFALNSFLFSCFIREIDELDASCLLRLLIYPIHKMLRDAQQSKDENSSYDSQFIVKQLIKSISVSVF